MWQEKSDTKQQIKVFKDKVFLNYINANVPSQFAAELGAYAETFFNKIKPEFIARQQKLLKGHTIDDDLEFSIGKNIDMLTAAIVSRNTVLKDVFARLNNKLKNVNFLINESEKIQPKNPAHEEKLAFLKDYKDLLITYKDPLKINNIVEVEDNAFNASYAKHLRAHNKIIEIYEILDKMKTHVTGKTDGNSPKNREIILKIDQLIEKLLGKDNETRREPAKRLKAVQEQVLDEDYKKCLSIDSDESYMSLLRNLWSTLTSWWQSQPYTLFRTHDSYEKKLMKTILEPLQPNESLNKCNI